MRTTKVHPLAGCLFLLAVFFLSVALLALLLQVAWNIVVPSIFGGPSLEYLQAVALLWLIWLAGAAFRTIVRVKD